VGRKRAERERAASGSRRGRRRGAGEGGRGRRGEMGRREMALGFGGYGRGFLLNCLEGCVCSYGSSSNFLFFVLK
jgi:hypothetical protein